ncbi:PD40 domain-containing protein [Candidatus Dependentiae bacterium]|nr:PD40 domain-containing protein [Candidatus Dependentiae bacterium]
MSPLVFITGRNKVHIRKVLMKYFAHKLPLLALLAFSLTGSVIQGMNEQKNLITSSSTSTVDFIDEDNRSHYYDMCAYLRYLPQEVRQYIISLSIDQSLQYNFISSKILSPQKSSINSVAFSPDGSLIASGHVGRTLCIWDALTGNLLKERKKHHKENIESVIFSPDGTTIASGSDDKTV